MGKLGKDEEPVRIRKSSRDVWKTLLDDMSATERRKQAKQKPTKKLFRVTSKDGTEEYLVASGSTFAWSEFLKMHPRAENIRPVRVPNEWNIRFPLLWRRIGIEMAREKYSRWRQEWNFIWAEITTVHERRYKLWFEDWINMWGDIGYYCWEHRSRWNYLEID